MEFLKVPFKNYTTIPKRKVESNMFVLGYFLKAVAVVLDYALTFYLWLVIARAILSWVSPDPYNPIVQFINRTTDPVLFHIRRYLPVSYSGIDFSPIIVLLVIIFLQTFLVNSLQRAAIIFL